jgi:hypothetical protein
MRKLGTLRGPDECGAADDAGKRDSRPPGDAGAGVCGPEVAEIGCAAGSVEPADFPDCAISGEKPTPEAAGGEKAEGESGAAAEEKGGKEVGKAEGAKSGETSGKKKE